MSGNYNYTEEDMDKLLFRLGLNPHYKGYNYTKYALFIIKENENALLFVTKLIYLQIARKYNTKCNAVDRCLRTISEAAWNNAQNMIEDMIGCKLDKRPTVSVFLKMLHEQLSDKKWLKA